MMTVAISVTSCKKGDCVDITTNEKVPITIGLSTSGMSYSDLPNSRADVTASDLLAVQIYEVDGDIESPYARGLFEDWSNLSFRGYSNTTYKVEATMVVDGTEMIYKDGDIYGLPFNSAALSDFEYNVTDLLEGIAYGTADVASGSTHEVYDTPNIDRYYGFSTQYVTEDNHTITTLLKRMSFGVILESVPSAYATASFFRLLIDGAPTTYMEIGETYIFSLYDLKGAYSADESISPYSEGLSVDIYLLNYSQIKLFTDTTVGFQRNKLATVYNDGVDNYLHFSFPEIN